MDEIIQQVLTAVLTALATVIGGFVIAWLNKLRQRVGLQADAEQDAKVRAAVQNAILSTEERLRAEALKRVAPLASRSEAKMAETMTKVLAAIPGVTAGEAARLINEELPKVRAAVAPAAAGFLGQVGTAAAPLPQSTPLEPSPSR
jgi:hypothetical protein